MKFSSQVLTNRREHFDFSFTEFFGDSPATILPSSFVVASATELASNGTPISGGAHVTVQQVVPGNNQVIVRVWVDNVPVGINVRCSVVVIA